MSDVYRICPECAGSVELDASFCPHCGHDTRAGLPVQRASLPATVSRAALPVAAGLAGLAVRAGWRLFRNYLEKAAKSQAPLVAAPKGQNVQRPTNEVVPVNRTPRRTIRIRSSWVIGDATGRWQQGTQEHIIEIDDN
jgi:hypothetical protein